MLKVNKNESFYWYPKAVWHLRIFYLNEFHKNLTFWSSYVCCTVSLHERRVYLCNDISKRKTTFIVGSIRERTISYLKTKKKRMQKMNKKRKKSMALTNVFVMPRMNDIWNHSFYDFLYFLMLLDVLCTLIFRISIFFNET